MLQIYNLFFQCLVLGHLAFEKPGGDAGLLLDTFWCEQVGIGPFAVTVLEVAGLDPALVD
jgi:hypothetical protein